MLFRPAALLAALALLILAPAAQAQERQWFESGPTPLRYEIAVTPDAAAGRFEGEARIVIETGEPLDAVTMNALELEIARAQIDGATAQASLDPEAQTLTLTPRRTLEPGRHVIRITYSGRIYDEAYGLFRVSYQDADGAEQRLLATQFEPGDARRLAPMWDQPNLRAVFQLTVTAPSGQMAVSNMPAERTERAGRGLTRTVFADTPSMPSYLLFMGVGDFERVTRDVDGVELGVIVRRGETHRTAYALEAGEQTLRYFTDYFGIAYPLPKLDMIGVPGAGGFGAMENWGAILYFDQYLLTDDNSSDTERRFVFEVVAHEVAHQWFGNLVTMYWWDDLWLNEGFASWMAAKATEALNPDWDPWLVQRAGGAERAMALDSRAGTHPVVQTVNTIDEANLAFNPITYHKGLAVIRMLEAYVGEAEFRQGVRDYLNAHLYGSARTESLWSAIQAASGEPVLDIARNFTGQPGFPVLYAQAAPCRRGRGEAEIALAQRRFAMDEVSRTDERWAIPVVAQRIGGAPVRAVLPAEGEAHVAATPACAPYLVNAGQSGFFRVLYDESNFAALTGAFNDLNAVDQIGLLLDYWAFARAGDAPFTDYLELAAHVPADADPIIAIDTITSIASLAAFAESRPGEEAVRAYARGRLQPFMQRVGWQPRSGESANEGLLRASVITALGGLGDDAVIGEARRRLAASQTDPSALPGSVRNAALSVYAYNARTEDYEALLAQARAASDFVDQRRLWVRLAGAADPALARRTLDLTLGETIPRQIRSQVISNVAAEHPRLAWDFLVAHRSAIETLLDPLQRLEFPPSIAAQSADPAMIAELEAYAADFPEGARATIAGASARIRINAETAQERMPAVEAWIAAR